MAAVIVFATAALFLGGVTIGILAVVCRGIHREDRLGSLGGEAPNRTSRSARRLTGFGRRDLDGNRLQSRQRLAA
jgi:hypothetical protein